MTSPTRPAASWGDMAAAPYIEQLAVMKGFPRERMARARVLMHLTDATTGPAQAQELVNALAASFDWWPGEREFIRVCIHFANSRRPMSAAAPAAAPSDPERDYEAELLSHDQEREQKRQQKIDSLKEHLAYLRVECKRVERNNPSSDYLARMEKERDRVKFELGQWERGAL